MANSLEYDLERFISEFARRQGANKSTIEVLERIQRAAQNAMSAWAL